MKTWTNLSSKLRWGLSIREVFNLDFYDLSYEHSNPELLDKIFSATRTVLPKRGVWLRIISFFWHWGRSLNSLLDLVPRKLGPRAIVLFATTSNQRDSLLPLLDKLPDARLVGDKIECDTSFPRFWAYFLSLPFLPFVLMRLWKSQDHRRIAFSYYLDEYWLVFGYYIVARLWLHRLSPVVLVLANDHSMEPRVLARAARDEAVLTVYMQHASVTSLFPPLTFDFALLDGLDALKTYERIAPSRTKIFLVGSPKFDKYYQYINVSSCVNAIGICTNWLDPVPRVEQLCSALRERFPALPLILRPHPSDRRVMAWRHMATRHQVSFSDSRKEMAFDFLRRVDVIIAGMSNIHLEAALLNVYPLYYDFRLADEVSYSFVETGLCEHLLDIEQLCLRLEELSCDRPNIRTRAKFYNAVVGTRYDGHSSELAGTLIQRLAAGHDLPPNGWKRIADTELVAYEPVS